MSHPAADTRSRAAVSSRKPRPLGWAKKCAYSLVTIGSLALLIEGGWRVAHGWQRNWLDCHRWHPTLGWSLREGWRGKWSWTDGIACINEQGIRDDAPVGPKAPGEKRLLVLGDSVTFGARVKTDAAYPAQLGRRLHEAGKPWRVLNGGVTSYDASQEADWLDLFGMSLEPDALAVAFCPNDVCPSDRGHAADHGPRDHVGRWLVEHSIVCYHLQRWVQGARVKLGLVGNPVLPASPTVDGWSQIESAYRQIHRRAHDVRIPVILIVFPSLDELEGKAETDVPARLHTLAAELGWPVIDLKDALNVDAAAQFLPNDPIHPSVSGHTRAADYLSRQIIDRALLP